MMMNKLKLKDYRTVSGDRRTHSEPTQTTKSMKGQGDNQWWWLLADTQRRMITHLFFQRKWGRKSDYLVSHENMSQHSSDPSELQPGNKQFKSSLLVVWPTHLRQIHGTSPCCSFRFWSVYWFRSQRNLLFLGSDWCGETDSFSLPAAQSYLLLISTHLVRSCHSVVTDGQTETWTPVGLVQLGAARVTIIHLMILWSNSRGKCSLGVCSERTIVFSLCLHI